MRRCIRCGSYEDMVERMYDAVDMVLGVRVSICKLCLKGEEHRYHIIMEDSGGIF